MKPEHFMLRALELAQLGLGSVAPNPSVGCVITYKNEIIGEGYTSPHGGNHAEVNAINSVEDQSLLPNSTLYVTLEPCAHFGKTPPCVNLVVEKKIKRVVIACLDPFAQVNGLGIKRLIEAGIDVRLGMLETEARELNRRFFTFHQKKRPYIILKWAETADGFVDSIRANSTEPSLKITSEAANILVHKWRAEEAAIMVGKNTALLDNPSLTTRKYEGKNPIRILLDGKLETPSDSNIFNNEAETILFCEREKEKGERKKETELIEVKSVRDLKSTLTELYNRDIQSMIIEGGPSLHASFYEAELCDEIRRFISQTTIKNGVKAIELNVSPEFETNVGNDRLLTYRNR
ncbi:MAG TPA: bifunctional diaminohydroxyphosphoribosylaminopyrimidine deaminase/5-amino-6-(5-phosphoribosylamino)uracil reductase RibD [Flavobacteriales bacterium]|nr:bifunctional diaminohydroxyphosphoribosylaminopyrimidine deaminase/5-amino-6-(5-phosphoribosylamino)uracil reductase RibD [Flavobacteriales bacterium]